MNAKVPLAENFAALGLPDNAIAYLLDVWDVFQGLDDWVDGTHVERDEQNNVIWLACVGPQLNSFFASHGGALTPVVANAVLKWQASDHVERHGLTDQYPKAYVWRAGYYDIVLQAVLIVHGPAKATRLAPLVMQLYGETYADYAKEFDHA